MLRALHALLLFVISAVVSRGLGPVGRGLYYTPLLAATTTIALCHLGLDQTNVYLFGTRRVTLTRLVGQAGLVALLAGLVGALGLVGFAMMVPAFFAGIPLSAIVVAAMLVPVGVHTIFSTGLLTVQGRVKAPLAASIAGAFMQLALLAALGVSGFFAPWPVFGTYALSILVTSAMLGAMLGERRLIAWDQGLLADSLRHSLVLHVGMTLLFLTLRVDMFLVKGMLGVQALGIYSLAVALAETVMLVTDSLSIALVPRQMGGTLRDAAATALAGARTIALIGVVLAAGWAIAGLFVVELFFGSAFEPVYLPLLVLLPGVVLMSMQRVCGPTVLRTGRAWTFVGLQAAGFVSNVLLNLWWIPKWGLVGTAAASTMSYGLSALGFLAWTGRLGGGSLVVAIPGVADGRRVLAAVRAYRLRPPTAPEP